MNAVLSYCVSRWVFSFYKILIYYQVNKDAQHKKNTANIKERTKMNSHIAGEIRLTTES